MITKKITDLFYWKWYNNFYLAINPRQIYENRWLLEKWKQTLFLSKVEADNFPSYNFWSEFSFFFTIFPSTPFIEDLVRDFEKSPETFLRKALKDCLPYWRFIPQSLRDLYIYYPKYKITFSEVEFVYLDYFFQLPQVIDSLLSELLVRDEPFREVILAEEVSAFQDFHFISKSNFYKEPTSPPSLANTFPKENLHSHVIDFLSGEEPENYFVKVITLYLNARPKILAECTQDLQSKGIQITEKSLAEEFLGYYIFKGVSQEALKFLVANSNLENKNPFKAQRKAGILEWNSFTEEVRQRIIKRHNEYLEEVRKKVEKRASQTHEEKVAIKKAFLKELDNPESDYNKNFKVAMMPISEVFPGGEKS